MTEDVREGPVNQRESSSRKKTSTRTFCTQSTGTQAQYIHRAHDCGDVTALHSSHSLHEILYMAIKLGKVQNQRMRHAAQTGKDAAERNFNNMDSYFLGCIGLAKRILSAVSPVSHKARDS